MWVTWISTVLRLLPPGRSLDERHLVPFVGQTEGGIVGGRDPGQFRHN